MNLGTTLILLLASGLSDPTPSVVINEIFYNPDSRRAGGEFVELTNVSAEAIDLSGWTLRGAVAFDFEVGAKLEPDDYLVMVRDKSRAARYGFGSVFGEFKGGLPNNGGTIRLLDDATEEVDAVTYSDRAPWPSDADGAGVSLELIDPSRDNAAAENWGLGNSMSPGARNLAATPNSNDVVITEIMYRPRVRVLRKRFAQKRPKSSIEEGEDLDAEYVEIFNRGKKTLKIGGWKVTNGIEFLLPDTTKIKPNEYLVICRNPTVLKKRFKGIKALGPFSGELANGGERITLVDGRSKLIDSVRYDDTAPWPTAPDEYGHSLEVIDPSAENNAAENWRSSLTQRPTRKKRASRGRGRRATKQKDPWRRFSTTGTATSSVLYVYVGGTGEWLLDDITMTSKANKRNLIPNGKFSRGHQGWNKTGNHGASNWSKNLGRKRSGCLRVVSNGVGGSARNSAHVPRLPGVRVGETHTLTCWVKHVKGNAPLTLRMSRGGLSTTISRNAEGRLEALRPVARRQLKVGPTGAGTPGSPNSSFSGKTPILVDNLRHTPEKPDSKNHVRVTGRLSDASGVKSIELLHSAKPNRSFEALPMHDDGKHEDGEAGDLVYGVTIPPYPSGTIVHYKIRVTHDRKSVTFFPAESEPSPTRAYFSDDKDVETKLTTYHLFVNAAELSDLDRDRQSRVYRKCDLAIDGVAYPNIGVRYRGAGSRGDPKRQWKFRFNKSKLYKGNRVLDTMVRRPLTQRLAFLVFDRAGLENLESDLVRVHLNGEFWGVYIVFESPNSSWLAKHGHHPRGEIYKARTVFSTQPGRNSDFYRPEALNDADYWGIWNKKVRPLAPPTHIREFTDNLNDLNDNQLTTWLDQNVDLDQWLTRWALYILMEIDDFPAHNYYLFLPGEPGSKWKWLAYDFDSMGRFGNLDPLYGDGKRNDDPGWQRNKFYERVSDNPILRRIYLLKMREVIETICPVETLHTLIDREFDRAKADVLLDYEKWGPPGARRDQARWGTFSQGTHRLKETLTRQRDRLRKHLRAEGLPLRRNAPAVKVSGGPSEDKVSISLSVSGDWNAYYTLDGSDPRLSPTRKPYRSAIKIGKGATLKAAAVFKKLSTHNWTDVIEERFE